MSIQRIGVGPHMSQAVVHSNTILSRNPSTRISRAAMTDES